MSSRMNMIPNPASGEDCMHQEMFAIKYDHSCEAGWEAGMVPLGRCVVGESGVLVGSARRCWKCDRHTAVTISGLCISCRDELRSW